MFCFTFCSYIFVARYDLNLKILNLCFILNGFLFTYFQTAAANGHDHVVRLLLMRGAALNKANSYGWTPLMHASRNGHANVVATLLQQRQADINAVTGLGASALTFAARGGHIQVVRQLVEAGIELTSSGGANECDFTPLLAAALYGHDAVLRFLLDRGCDVNFRTSTSGLTPLMVAALNGHMKTAQILVERGADPNVTNADNRTALDIASMRMKREVAAYLERKTTNKPERGKYFIYMYIIPVTLLACI